MKTQHGFIISQSYLALAGVLLVAFSLLVTLLAVQSWRLAEAKSALQVMKTVAENAQKETDRITRENTIKKERADEDYQRLIRERDAAVRRLRDNAGGSSLPPAKTAAEESARICYSRPVLDGALRTFTSGIAEIIAECDAAVTALNNARKWAKE